MTVPSMTPDIRAYRNGIAYRMFFDTADLNYVGARASFFERRDWDFWWLTLHAVEKYLKTLLLVNGESARSGGHDLDALLGHIRRIDPRLQPPPFTPPRVEGLNGWPDIPDDAFLRRLNEYGSASNRYGTYGYALHPTDLFRADQLIYWARRHARPLTTTVQTSSGERVIDWIDVLVGDPHQWTHHRASHLERLARLPSHSSERRPFAKLNATFFPQTRHRMKGWRSSATNPPIAEWVGRLETSEPGSDSRVMARAVLQWVIDNIQLLRDDRLELEGVLAAHN